MVPSLTVFTPTYNRAHTLHLCYESLLRQSCKDFVWLIIDDGSTDRTRELVEGWISEGRIAIRYHYQDNLGMHGGHNAAYERIDTELNVCIDSDDYLADDAVDKILTFWKKYGSEQYAGIVGLDASPDGEIIGTDMPEGLKASTLSGLYAKWKVKGDKKLVYRTAMTSSVPPYPIFPGEKYVPLSYKYLLIDQQLPLLIMNEVLCHVEYRADGSSLNMMNQYRKNPQGFAFFRKVAMVYAPSFKERLREAVHYVSSSLIMGNRKFIAESPRKGMTVLALPLGSLLYLYIRRTQRAAPISATETPSRIRPVQESDSQ
ncbi:glycosyltransferase family A protein [Paenibacillus durus]|uniref:Beta-glycosyltransferase n=1 Tax=Paenibacillus durus ATCC 35681 TaxID=1333534 RepID=A0A0F7F6D1_PAEDU|nr:glycosyltransferase family 2 protein [Paenibacillus durus]AKG33399.1 beta-glycosyltransferase [Paenibacillus durus ATCC 35681]